MTSILAFCWPFQETGDATQIAVLARSIYRLVLPSLVLFIVLPLLLEHGVAFVWALVTASALTAIVYGAMALVLPRIGVNLG